MSLLINSYRFAAGGGGFDPRSITGLVAWYSAEAVTGLADGDQMTTWADLSGLGNDATGAAGSSGIKPKWRSAQGPSSGAAVEFTAAGTVSGGSGTGDGYFTLPSGLMGSATSGEILIYVKETQADNGLWAFGGENGTSYNGTHFPWSSDGNIYDGWGVAATQRKNFAPGVTLLNAWRRYNVWSAASDWAARIDGSSVHTSTTSTVTWASSPLLGATTFQGSLDVKFKGFISAVVVYSRKLTTTERSNLDAWLVANPSGGTV